jgi:diguanylate cyclase (GGDEF)-like protein/PAS domain S-box-containing protein
MTKRSAPLVAALGVAVLYFAAAMVPGEPAFTAGGLRLVSLPMGVSLAALLLLNAQLAPAGVGVFAGALAAALLRHVPARAAVAIGVGNAGAVVVAVWLLRGEAEFHPAIDRLRDAVALIVIAALVSTISATVGVASLCAAGVLSWADFETQWGAWWLANTNSSLLVAPLILVWARRPLTHLPLARTLEAIALVVSLLATVAIAFGSGLFDADRYQLKYLVFPFLVWAAIRFDTRGAATASALAAFFAAWGTTHGLGPYWSGAASERVVLVQVFICVAAGTGLLLGAAIAERNASEARKLGLLEGALDCIITTDEGRRIVEFNQAAEGAFGYQRSEAIGRLIDELIAPESHREQYRQAHASAWAGYAPTVVSRIETMAMRADRSEFPAELSTTKVPGTVPPLFTTFLRDITDRQHIVRQLAFRATHDGLTGLFNRSTFIARLTAATRVASETGTTIAVLYVDLDKFKSVNDRFGHSVGDSLLLAAALRLRGCVRPGDTLARLGGDEFAILIEHVTDETDVSGVADRVRYAVDQPFSIDGQELAVSASIGIALSSDEVGSAEAVLRAADAAMYRAKTATRARSTNSYRL